MIAIFDSGLGGLTAVREFRRLCPGESYIYFGDTGRVPYGTRSRETIIKYARQDMRFLLGAEHNVTAVLVACGTVSATALSTIRGEFGVPVFGVVETAAAAAAKATRNGRVAVIATAASIRSGAYERELSKRAPGITVTAKACPLFVPLVENGFTGGDEITILTCERYLKSVRESGADTCILGCTHYPLIRDEIAGALPGVTLIDSGAEAAKAVAALSGAHSVGGEPRYYVSDDASGFLRFASALLGDVPPSAVSLIDIERY